MSDQAIQRKLAAILYADVAGYSRLTGQDEDATHEALRAGLSTLTRAIEGRGGKVNHYAGDAILAEFGSVVGCVEMAVEVQRRFADENRDVPEDQQLLFRIGIHMAEVIDDGGEIYGDGVNIAARLEALAEPGGICVTGVVADQVRHRLDVSVEDMGDHQVKNIENPIRAYRVGIAAGASSEPSPAPEMPSIAVLPFENFSSDPEQEYFSDGVAEDIITALSRIGWPQVTARNSTFSYKGQSPDLRDVAKDLNVRYVLEGSIRKAGERIRVSVQLIDGGTGNHIWAERYDRELEDIFDLQDEITATVASAIEPELAQAEINRSSSKHMGNLDAWDLFQRGTQCINRDSLEGYYGAQELFRQAIALDPRLAAPHAGLCRSLAMVAYLDTTSDREPLFEEAQAEGRKATELDRDDTFGFMCLGLALLTHGVTTGNPEKAISTLEQGLAINPNNAYLQSALGRSFVYSGQAAEGVERLLSALRLSPRDIQLPQFMEALTTGYFTLGDYEAVLEWSTKAHNARNTATYHRVAAMRVAALAELDRMAEARSECAALTANYPHIIQAIQDFKISAQADLIAGLQKAGMEGF